MAAARCLINMTHPGDKFVNLLSLSRLLFGVSILENEIKISHRLVHHFDVVEVGHISNELLF